MSKIFKYTIIFGLTSIIILYAINIQYFNINLINPVFAKDEPTKELQVRSNSSTISNAQTYGIGSPFIASKAPQSNAETNVIQGGFIGGSGITESKAPQSNAETNVIQGGFIGGSGITGSKAPSSNAETNGGYNPINSTNGNCSSNPQLLIACNPTNTNCGINPQAPPCCVQPTSDKSCNKITNPTSTNCSSDPRLLIACGTIPSSNTNCGINQHAAPCCVEPSSCNKDINSTNPANPTNTNCGSDPRLLIACGTIPSSNTNCGINPQAPPCCVQPTSDKSCMQIRKADMSNINTNPQNVHVGQQFKIQATITNNLNSPIKFVGNICGTSPLNIEFDNNVQIQNTNTCQAISFTTLNPNDTTTVQGSGGTIFTAANPGTTNAKIAFNYNTEGDKQDSTTKSFTFEILP